METDCSEVVSTVFPKSVSRVPKGFLKSVSRVLMDISRVSQECSKYQGCRESLKRILNVFKGVSQVSRGFLEDV